MSKIIFITGATSGIGKATAEVFAENGYCLILCGRRSERLGEIREDLETKYKVKVLPLTMDIRKRAEVKTIVENLPDEWARIDILLNNAGLAAGFDPVDEADIDDWEQMIDTNIKGLLYVSRAVLPGMTKRKAGHIINIGSIAGKETYINGNVYCATKHAVDSLTKAMRMDLLKHGIRVSQVAPGAVETEFAQVRFKGDKIAAANVYKGYKPLTPEDVASAIYYVASQPEHVCINDLVIMPAAQASTVHWKKD